MTVFVCLFLFCFVADSHPLTSNPHDSSFVADPHHLTSNPHSSYFVADLHPLTSNLHGMLQDLSDLVVVCTQMVTSIIKQHRNTEVVVSVTELHCCHSYRTGQSQTRNPPLSSLSSEVKLGQGPG